MNHLDAAYAYLALAVPSPSATTRDNTNRMAVIRTALKTWNTGYTHPPTFVDSYAQPQRSFDDATARQVATIRAGADPHGLFRSAIAPIRD